jgi:DNA adenine methylase
MNDPITSVGGLARNTWASPFLRWAGSKRRMLGVLRECIPSHFDRYIEPFAGSACVFFSIGPVRAILGDNNDELIQMYLTVREHPRKVARAMMALPGGEREYYLIRSQDPSSLDPVGKAARFIYLNRHCFNGVFRTNRKGQFNVPLGSKLGRVPHEQLLYRCAYALRMAELKSGDFETTLGGVKRGDFVYLDPPYGWEGRKRYGEYGYDCFQENDVERMLRQLRVIDKAGAQFLLSYSASAAVTEQCEGWHLQTLVVRRHVAGFAKFRKEVKEILVSNYPIDRNNTNGIAQS